MKIIKIGETKKYIEVAKCLSCKTEVEFNKSECFKISYNVAYSNIPPYLVFNSYYINCPCCKMEGLFGYSKEID